MYGWYVIVVACFQINEFSKSQSANTRPMTVEEVAMGYLQVANEAMCRPIRSITQVTSIIIIAIRCINLSFVLFPINLNIIGIIYIEEDSLLAF